MPRDRHTSLLWIVILLAALFIGPAILIKGPIRRVEPGPMQDLRSAIEAEELLDAPAPLPKGAVQYGGPRSPIAR